MFMTHLIYIVPIYTLWHYTCITRTTLAFSYTIIVYLSFLYVLVFGLNPLGLKSYVVRGDGVLNININFCSSVYGVRCIKYDRIGHIANQCSAM